MTLRYRYNNRPNNDFLSNEKIQNQNIYAELSDRLDCLQKSVANLRIDIPLRIREQILEILRDDSGG